ncbi:hypothetical protein [Epilithonimonas caeni]|uniref:hypothetical protein n=1 Tax=Epilithonimonas caeni TaxID=365343 RepID=UPI0012EBFDAF|nr:hypothetical protein [Epilithonimonas caeni]
MAEWVLSGFGYILLKKLIMRLIRILILLSLFSCEKDSKEKFYKIKQNPDFILWKNIETISENDFEQKTDEGNSNSFIQIMTRIDIPKNELLYFVYFDKEKSNLNINQPKDSIDNIILYTNLKMDCYEIVARKYVQKFINKENLPIENRRDSKYITDEIVSKSEQELKKLSHRIWYSKFDKDTISKIKLEIYEKLK